jgi:hypothetical protein
MLAVISAYLRLFWRALVWAFWPSLKLGTAVGSGVWLVLGIFLTRKILREWGWFEVTVSDSAYEPALIALGAFAFLFIARMLAALYVLAHQANDDLKGQVAMREAQLTRLNAELAKGPKLVASFDSIGVSEEVTQAPNQNAYIAFVTVLNSGSPSVAINWRVSIEIEGIRSIASIGHYDSLEFQNPTMRLRGQDAIYQKAALPIPEGGMTQGFIVALLPKQPDKPARHRGAKMYIEFNDVTGAHHEISYEIRGGTSDDLQHFPLIAITDRVPNK